MIYGDIGLFIDGIWRPVDPSRTIAVENPASGRTIGQVAVATRADVDDAIAAAERGFAAWRTVNGHERSKILRKAAALLRERSEAIAPLLTLEHGKPIADARGEIAMSVETIDWFADEARRTYGRVIPGRNAGIWPLVMREPVGIVAAFTPWNLPMSQVVRKVAAALAAGCAIIVKGPEETPAAPAALIQAFADAGVPAGAIALLYGEPAEISSYLIPHPAIAKISFTGSVPVGKQLAALAGLHMKRATMELGGHAPVIICDDADVAAAAKALAGSKVRNSGQTCISPTRFIVQRRVHDAFADAFVTAFAATRVGDGMEPGVQMGPLIHGRRRDAVERLVADARERGASLLTGGERIGNAGYFYAPTVLSEATPEMAMMNEEPFGPVAALMAFDDLDEAVAEANRLPVGLGAYAFSASARTVNHLAEAVRVGMIRFNHLGGGGPETPFGGIGDSGYGWECGSEGMDAYLTSKFVSHAGI